jgi:GT2 family glycosyltransferase
VPIFARFTELPIQGEQDAGFARLLRLALPAGAPGQWMIVRVSARGALPWWVKLEIADSARDQIVREGFFGPMRRRQGVGRRELLLHIPGEAGAMALSVYGEAEAPTVSARVLSRAETALHLAVRGYHRLPLALRGWNKPGLAGCVRAVLGQAPAQAGQAPPYAVWRKLFASTPQGIPAAPTDMQLVVVGQDEAGIAVSLASAGPLRASACVVRIAEEWAGARADWLLVLGAGEVLADDAPARFAAARAGGAGAVYADLDQLGADGNPCDPLFKPGPGRVLLRSGYLTTGACLFRRRDDFPDLPAQAEAARLALALAAPSVARIAQVLTHVPPENPGQTQLGVDIVNAELDRAGMSGNVVRKGGYLRVCLFRPSGFRPKVSIIVPSACRAAHVMHCLSRIALDTDYPDFEIILAMSEVSPEDARQSRNLRRLLALPRCRVLTLRMPGFNYAAVNNAAAAAATGDVLLLLNDDVAPIRADWLSDLVAYMQMPDVGAVGARLLYGNDMVQHGGVIMGLANLCEHADRLRRAEEPGMHALASLDREVSAVTGACMLIRAGLFRELGGMDEGFAIALNDVDLCMRLRVCGQRIVYAANVCLHHYESLSLGRHYAGARAGLEQLEVRRLRERWADVIADDPYYSPNASLEPVRLWQPAFPQRPSAQAASALKTAARR